MTKSERMRELLLALEPQELINTYNEDFEYDPDKQELIAHMLYCDPDWLRNWIIEKEINC